MAQPARSFDAPLSLSFSLSLSLSPLDSELILLVCCVDFTRKRPVGEPRGRHRGPVAAVGGLQAPQRPVGAPVEDTARSATGQRVTPACVDGVKRHFILGSGSVSP